MLSQNVTFLLLILRINKTRKIYYLQQMSSIKNNQLKGSTKLRNKDSEKILKDLKANNSLETKDGINLDCFLSQLSFKAATDRKHQKVRDLD